MSQELTYKDLDGASAGAADQIKYEYLSDCPDIPAKTWSYVGNDASGQAAIVLPESTAQILAAHIPAVDGTTGASQFSTGEALTPGVEQDRHQLDDVQDYLQSQDKAFFSYERQADGDGGQNFHVYLTTGEVVKAPKESSGKAACKVESLLDQSAMDGVDDNGFSTGEGDLTLVGRDKMEEQRSESATGGRGRQVEQPEWLAGIVHTRNDSSYPETGAATYDIESEEVLGRMELS